MAYLRESNSLIVTRHLIVAVPIAQGYRRFACRQRQNSYSYRLKKRRRCITSKHWWRTPENLSAEFTAEAFEHMSAFGFRQIRPELEKISTIITENRS